MEVPVHLIWMVLLERGNITLKIQSQLELWHQEAIL